MTRLILIPFHYQYTYTYFRTKIHTTTIVHGSNFKSAPIWKLLCNSIASTPQIPAHHQIPTTSLIILIPSENCAPSSPLHRVHPPLCYLPPSCTTHGIKTIRYLPHTRRTHGCLGRSSGRAIWQNKWPACCSVVPGGEVRRPRPQSTSCFWTLRN